MAARSQVHPANDGERLASLEQCMNQVEQSVERIEHKLDLVIEQKADRSDLRATADTVAEHQTAIDKFRGALLIVGVFGPVFAAVITHWILG
jgi:uncharacterized coiled-coil protein SlyX